MGVDGGLTAVAVVVEQLLALVHAAGGHEDEVGHAVDVVQFGLAVPVLAVVDEAALPLALPRGVHAVEAKNKKVSIRAGRKKNGVLRCDEKRSGEGSPPVQNN